MTASRPTFRRFPGAAARLAAAAVAAFVACGPAHHDATPAGDEKPATRAPGQRSDRDGRSASPWVPAAAPREAAAARVIHVIDGDTLEVSFEALSGAAQNGSGDRRGAGRSRGARRDPSERVRVLGVDTPEAHPGPKLDRDARRRHRDQETILALGRRATAYTRERLAGRSVRLEFDVRERDKYGRLLAWVWLDDGSLFNAALVRDGYARTMTIPPNVKYSEQLRGLEREARRQDRGLWRDGM